MTSSDTGVLTVFHDQATIRDKEMFAFALQLQVRQVQDQVQQLGTRNELELMHSGVSTTHVKT